MKKALVLSLALVFGLGIASFAQTLSGTWDTDINITATNPVVLTFTSDLTVTYSISGWSFTSDSGFEVDYVLPDGWTKQVFTATGALGAFTIGSTLTFNPATVTFTSWEVTGGLSLAGVSFDGTFTLTPNVTELEIIGAGSAGNVDVEVTLTLGDGLGCNFNFGGVDIEVQFPFCCADIISTLSFGCAGFEQATFEVAEIVLPGLPWVTLDAVLTFTMTEKTLEITPNFDFGASACFKLYLSWPEQAEDNVLLAPVHLFTDVTLDGIGLSCTIGGVQFTGLSFWGEGPKPGILKGTEYWEAYQIKTTDDGCCGPFAFDITVYFEELGVQLFDVAALVANMSIQISNQFTFSTGISLTLPATYKLSFGFEVAW